MRLSQITESSQRLQTFYKGMTIPNFEKFKEHMIPGFMGDIELVMVYSDPRTQRNESVVIISAQIPVDEIEDKQDIVDDMCGWGSMARKYSKTIDNDAEFQKYDKSTQEEMKIIAGLRNKIWWSNSGGHGRRGIYVGRPVNYEVVLYARTPEEYYEELASNDEIRRLGAKYKHLSGFDVDEEHPVFKRQIHWSDYS